MNSDSGCFELAQTAYIVLNAPPPMDECLLLSMDSTMSNESDWAQCYHCITMLRSLTKYTPQHTLMLFIRYESVLHSIFQRARPQLIKNLLMYVQEIMLIQECVSHGMHHNVQNTPYYIKIRVIQSFGCTLLKRSVTIELKHIKEMIQETMTGMVYKCSDRNVLLSVGCEALGDKNDAVVECGLRFVGAVIGNKCVLIELEQETLMRLIKSMNKVIREKKNNVKNVGLDVCIGICRNMGSDNYLKLMAYALSEEQVYYMGVTMEQHRVVKSKPEPLASAIKKKRISEIVYNSYNHSEYNNSPYNHSY